MGNLGTVALRSSSWGVAMNSHQWGRQMRRDIMRKDTLRRMLYKQTLEKRQLNANMKQFKQDAMAIIVTVALVVLLGGCVMWCSE